MRKIFPLAMMALLFAGCIRVDDLPVTDRVNVAATFYPLAYLAEQIGGQYVEVRQIVPAGTEPHEFEPSPQDLEHVYDAKLFLWLGAGVDPWAARIAPDVMAKGVHVLQLTQDLELRESEEEADRAADLDDVDHGKDPHVWLDPDLMMEMANVVVDGLRDVDPSHTDQYRQNAERLQHSLSELDAAFTKGLQNCELDTVIVAHDAFEYLANQYGFETLSIAGLSPEEEPSAAGLAALVQEAKKAGITHILYEPTADSSYATTLAQEIGGQSLPLHPIESLMAEEKKTQSYVTLMELNLQSLRTAMRCQ